jgi:GAF domain-containing protein
VANESAAVADRDARIAQLERQLAQRSEELGEALRQQAATAEVLKALSRPRFDLKTVLNTLVETAARLCEAEQSLVFRFDGTRFHLAADLGYAEELSRFLQNHPLEIGRGTTMGRIALERNTVHIPDVLADPDYTFLEGQKRGGWRAVLGVPLIRDGELIGGFSLNRTEPRPFSERQIALVTTFADQAVIALEIARLFDEVEARNRELTETLEQQTATSEILRVISKSPTDVQPVFDMIARSAARLCRAEFCFVFRFDGRLQHPVAYHGVSQEGIEAVRGVFPAEPNLGSAAGRAILSGRVEEIADVLSDPDYSVHAVAKAVRYRSAVGVPMLKDGRPIGSIAVTRAEVGLVPPRQLRVLQTFAEQAVIAIENARLFEEVQARTRELAQSVAELRALGEVSQAVNSTLDLETVLSTIVAKAVQLSETDAGAIYVFSNRRQIFRLRATYGMDHALIEAIGRQTIRIGESTVGRAAERRMPVEVADLEAEPPNPVTDIVLRAGYRALLVIPLLRSERPVGALVVRRRAPGAFAPATVELLQTFAAQSVVAIQNARLYADVEARTRELAQSLAELRAAQDRLVQTEKLASLGQLTAGIAHEIKNPLNFVNNFAALAIELADELGQELRGFIPAGRSAHVDELLALLSGNLGKVVEHGNRADSIVKNMLLHSRAGTGERVATNVNALVEESLNLAYHGARAGNPGFRVAIEKSLDPAAGTVVLFPQEVTRALINVVTNGFHAATRGEKAPGHEPALRVATRGLDDAVEITIRDNGSGIPEAIRDRIFEPFFTTKAPGEGTGLGLSLSHDIIVKRHGGSIAVDTAAGAFTEFRIVLPRGGDG